MGIKLIRAKYKHIGGNIYLLRVFFILIGIGLLTCAFRSENDKFKVLVEEFISETFASQPAFATACGVHDFDDRLDDIDVAALENQMGQLEHCAQKLALIDTTKLTLKNRADYILLNNYIQNRLLDLKEVKIWEKDPVIFTEALGNSLYWLLHHESADWDFRLQNILKRLYQVPRFIEQVKDYVVAATPCHITVAVEQTQGLIEFIGKDLSESFHHVPSLQDTLRQVSREAIQALDSYRKHLRYELLPHASEHFRLGEAMFQKKVQLFVGSEITLEEILKLADEALQNIQSEMMSIAQEVHKRHFPERRYTKSNNGFNEQLLSDALNDVMSQSLSKEELLPFLEGQLRDAIRFVELKELVKFELNVPAKFEFMPLFLQGYSPTYYMLPGIRRDARTPVDHFTFFFYTGHPQWNWIQNLNYYKAYNREMLRVFILSYLVPGSYLQYNYLEKNPSNVQRLFGDPLVRGGWQIYSPYIMRKAGYTGYEPRFILMQLKYTFNCILDAILDVKIHTANLSEQDAKILLQAKGFMKEPEIELHWRKICLKPTDQTIKFIGYMKLMQLQNQYREKVGNLYNQKRFNENVLKSGFIPVHIICKSLLE